MYVAFVVTLWEFHVIRKISRQRPWPRHWLQSEVALFVGVELHQRWIISRVRPLQPVWRVVTSQNRSQPIWRPPWKKPVLKNSTHVFAGDQREREKFLRVFVCLAGRSFVASNWISLVWSLVSLLRPCLYFQTSALFYCLIMCTFSRVRSCLAFLLVKTQLFLILLLHNKSLMGYFYCEELIGNETCLSPN